MSKELKSNIYKLEPGIESTYLSPLLGENPLAYIKYSYEF